MRYSSGFRVVKPACERGQLEKEFRLDGDYIELIKLLKVIGACQTGGHAKVVVSEGLVSVDGEVETRKKKKIRAGQVVEFEDYRITIV